MTDEDLGSWDEYVGPFYDTAGVLRLLRMSANDLESLVKIQGVLRLITGDGMVVYPAFQFGSDGTPLPHLREALNCLNSSPSHGWGDALWLNAPEDDLDGLTPAQALRTDRFEEALLFASQAGSVRLS
ncbi:hypothetical protein [Frondihabitans australicus]|uniref:Antitoxin Xre/MbcA/ParS-like toxin-binding domain-containing protein n=1 Tax=Frondihabitans australicus TaxID=386892 RepID=A0A495IH34_9MICO|nr:hypothetical protein [Frondihabitans australicus]RKR74758.1 hypothetical protein C8E83_1887 [Frondihabitans australicus]